MTCSSVMKLMILMSRSVFGKPADQLHRICESAYPRFFRHSVGDLARLRSSAPHFVVKIFLTSESMLLLFITHKILFNASTILIPI